MRVVWLSMVLTMGGLAACSKPAQEAPSPTIAADAPAITTSGKARPCTVLAEAEVSTALGKPVGKPARDEVSICQYVVSGERIADTAQATLTIEPVGLAALRPGIAAQDGTMETIKGIGDGAFYSPQFGLYVEHGGRTGIYLIGSNSIPDDRERELVIELAEATVSRL